MTLEHVWPEWARKFLFPNGGDMRVRHATDDADPHREYSGPQASIKARVVCEACNGGWMSDLEVHAGPLIRRISVGKPASLRSGDQSLLALWALKTAVVFHHAHLVV